MLQPNSILLAWLLVLPFFAAGCALLFPRLALPVHSEREKAAMAWAPFSLGALASLMAVGLAASLWPAVAAGGRVVADYWWTRDLYHLRFQADGLSLAAALAICAIGGLIHLHLVGLRASGQSHYRAALLLAAQGSGVATVLSADLIALLFFLGLMLVCLWLLASLGRVREDTAQPDRGWRAGGLLVAGYVGGLFLAGAALLMWQRAGDSSVDALPLLLLSADPFALRGIALLTLIGLLPYLCAVPAHGWLPALLPAGRSAAIAPATLLVIVGTALALRLLAGTLVLGTIPGFYGICVGLGLLTLCWGALRAWLVRDLAGLAVWLTVAQSGHLLVAVGGSASPTAPAGLPQAGALHLAFSPLAVLTIWCVSSAVVARVGTDGLPGLSGLFRRMPLAGLALLAGGLSLAGLPPLAGFQVQRLLISGLLADQRPALAAVILLANLLIAAAVLRAFRRAFLRREPPPPVAGGSGWLSAQLALLVVALLVPGLWTTPLLGWSETIFRTALSVSP